MCVGVCVCVCVCVSMCVCVCGEGGGGQHGEKNDLENKNDLIQVNALLSSPSPINSLSQRVPARLFLQWNPHELWTQTPIKRNKTER